MIYEYSTDPWSHCVRLWRTKMYIENNNCNAYTGKEEEEETKFNTISLNINRSEPRTITEKEK